MFRTNRGDRGGKGRELACGKLAKWTFIVTAPWALHKRYRPLRGTLGVQIVPFQAFWLTRSSFDLKGDNQKVIDSVGPLKTIQSLQMFTFSRWDR